MFTVKVSKPVDRTAGFINKPREIDVSINTRNILVVDADRNVLNQISQSFAICAKHYNILTAHNGREAVETLQSNPVDILLTDLHVAAMNGFSLMDYTRFYYPATRIFVMSEGDPSTLKNILSNLGICGYISKPYRIEMIYSVLRI
jgi:DNA-binding response OmpR family regulator